MRWLRLTVALLAATVFLAPAVVAYAQPPAKAEKAERQPSPEEGAAATVACCGLPLAAAIAAGLAGVAVYLVPTFVALWRGHPNSAPIIIVNILLGWSLLGWVVALAWAVSTFDPPRRRSTSTTDDNPFG